jgi:hypothetical protein
MSSDLPVAKQLHSISLQIGDEKVLVQVLGRYLPPPPDAVDELRDVYVRITCGRVGLLMTGLGEEEMHMFKNDGQHWRPERLMGGSAAWQAIEAARAVIVAYVAQAGGSWVSILESEREWRGMERSLKA